MQYDPTPSERRVQAEQRQRRFSLTVSILLHGSLIAVALLGPALTDARSEPLEFVAVQVVPLQALGERTPTPTPPRAEPEPQLPEPEPEPIEQEEEPEPEPQPEVPQPEPVVVQPPVPRGPTAEREQPAPAPRESEPAPRQGSPEGNPAGTATFGSTMAMVDNPEFTYSYYLERMLALIGSYWRPTAGDGQLQTVVHFRIARDGSVSQLQVIESSGVSSFDLAGLRAVQSASPLPPLPASFRHESLGVNLILR